MPSRMYTGWRPLLWCIDTLKTSVSRTGTFYEHGICESPSTHLLRQIHTGSSSWPLSATVTVARNLRDVHRPV